MPQDQEMSTCERSKAEDIVKVPNETESRGSAKNRGSATAEQTRISVSYASCMRSRVLPEPYQPRSGMTMCHQQVLSGDGGALQERRGSSHVFGK